MGCNLSTEQDESDPFLQDRLLNNAIEQTLNSNKHSEKNEIKLLLLGAGESGKSTVLKQLKILHKGGFTNQERMQYSQIIWCDVIQSMKILIIQARTLGIKLDCDETDSLYLSKKIVLEAEGGIDKDVVDTDFLNDYVLKYDEKPRREDRDIYNKSDQLLTSLDDYGFKKVQNSTYSRAQIAESIHTLWMHDSGIKECFDRSNEFQLESSASYYFENVFEFVNPKYMCSNVDILNGRIKTTGITETNFVIKSLKIKVLDAGGQRSERKKWIHCFDKITAILFVLAISEYDQMLFEDERINRMHESIVLFDSLCNSKWFVNTPFILFLNKIDLFEKKLARSSLKRYFPDYLGDDQDVDKALKFFENNFLKLNRTNKPVYVHRTCATDTNSMKFVLSAVTDMIVQGNLKRSGFI